MDPTGLTYNLITLFILLSLSAFFSASETALFSLNKLRIINLKDNAIKNADKLYRLLENPDSVLTAILILNNMVNILTSSLTTVIMYNLVGNAGVSIATGIVTILVLIFGEITPKTLAIQNSEKISLKIVPLISILVFILKPLIYIFSNLSKTIVRMTGKNKSNNDLITEAELKTILNFSNENGILKNSEKEMIDNVFEFGDLQVKDIMIQRVNMISINIDSTYDEVISVIKKEQYSRIPVFVNNPDTVIGLLNIKDILLGDYTESNFDLKSLVRDVNYTFEFKKIEDLFKEMKKNKSHMCIVLDEYGTTSGVITMEDLIEKIVGDIDDEYDTIDDMDIIKINEKEFIVNGSTRLEDVNDVAKLDLHMEDCDSIGGVCIKILDRVPNINEEICFRNLNIKILDIDKNRIKKIKITIGVN